MIKKLVILTGLFFSINSAVNAYSFVPPMSFFVNREVATARVFNTTHFPIICSGQAYGQTHSGVVLNTWINNMVIYPGQWADAVVFSNYYDPFFTAWANIGCVRAF